MRITIKISAPDFDPYAIGLNGSGLPLGIILMKITIIITIKQK